MTIISGKVGRFFKALQALRRMRSTFGAEGWQGDVTRSLQNLCSQFGVTFYFELSAGVSGAPYGSLVSLAWELSGAPVIALQSKAFWDSWANSVVVAVSHRTAYARAV